MRNFTYHSPTKIVFGKDQIQQLETLLKAEHVQTLLLVYGKQSIKTNGIYDTILTVCKNLDITVIEECGVEPNPDVKSVYSGVKKAKANQVDFVLAAGGGSVIDCAKAISLGACLDGDVWDLYLLKRKATKALPLGVVITLAATGTETNGNSVLSNRARKEKRSVSYQFNKPVFAIIDPAYTLTVNRHHTIAGSIDIIMHIFEQYFANTPHTETSDYMMMGVLQSVIENTDKILNGNDNYDVRANISWASTVTLNFILGIDKAGDWATHRLSYSITKRFNTTHGYALALIFTSWARVVQSLNPTTMNLKLSRLGRFVFNETDPLKVIDKIDDLFNRWGVSTRLSQFKPTITEDIIDDFSRHATALGPVGQVVKIDQTLAKQIYLESLN